MYKVISYFTDLQDHNHPYNVGDIFPRNGLKVSEERLKELSSNKNKQNKPLIKLIIDKMEVTEQVTQATPYTKTDINRMSTADLQKLADNNGVDNAKELSGSKLKKILIDKLCK